MPPGTPNSYSNEFHWRKEERYFCWKSGNPLSPTKDTTTSSRLTEVSGTLPKACGNVFGDPLKRAQKIHICTEARIVDTSFAMRADQLSRRMFYAGCAGLPWLWIVHTLYFFNKIGNEHISEQRNALLQQQTLGVTSCPAQDPPHHVVEQEEYEIYMIERKWVFRCRNAALLVVSSWLIWIIVVQVLAVGILPGFLYVRRVDPGDYTGW